MPPGKNRFEGNDDIVVDKRQKKTHEPASDTLKDPDADVVDEEGEDEDGEDRNEGGMHFGDIYIPPAPAPSLTMDARGPRLVITHITPTLKTSRPTSKAIPENKCWVHFTRVLLPSLVLMAVGKAMSLIPCCLSLVIVLTKFDPKVSQFLYIILKTIPMYKVAQ